MKYFAYGSNMNLDQMSSRCGKGFKVEAVARLDNYELGFDRDGYANIRPLEGGHVYGVLYEINEKVSGSLDRYEGYNSNPRVYDRGELEVKKIADESGVGAVVYFERAENFGHPAKQEYLLDRIIKGAQENNLPAEWITHLQSFIK